MVSFIIGFIVVSVIFISIRESIFMGIRVKQMAERHKKRYIEIVSNSIIKYVKENPDSEFSKKIKKFSEKNKN